MSTTTTNLADALTLAARLLADNPTAPEVVSVHVRDYYEEPYRLVRAVAFQLGSVNARTEFLGIARWAALLDTAVVITERPEFVKIEARAEVDGLVVEVWDHLTPSFLKTLPPDLAARYDHGAIYTAAEIVTALGANPDA